MSVQDLASMLALPATEVVKFLFMKGIMVQVGGWFGRCFECVFQHV